MSYGQDHDHRGEYADERHDHDIDYAPKDHRHYSDERQVEDLQKENKELRASLDELRERFNSLAHAFDQETGPEGALFRHQQMIVDLKGRVERLESGRADSVDPFGTERGATLE